MEDISPETSERPRSRAKRAAIALRRISSKMTLKESSAEQRASAGGEGNFNLAEREANAAHRCPLQLGRTSSLFSTHQHALFSSYFFKLSLCLIYPKDMEHFFVSSIFRLMWYSAAIALWLHAVCSKCIRANGILLPAKNMLLEWATFYTCFCTQRAQSILSKV